MKSLINKLHNLLRNMKLKEEDQNVKLREEKGNRNLLLIKTIKLFKFK